MVLSRSQTIGIIGYFPANRFLTQYTVFNWRPVLMTPQPSPHFSYSEINALPLNGQQAVTAISALWLRRSTAFRWLQQPIGRHLMIDVVEQVIERHQEVKNEGISEALTEKNAPKHLREIVKYMTEIFTRLMIVIAPATMLIGKPIRLYSGFGV